MTGSGVREEQRIVLLGCGAVGGVIAGGLPRAGHQVAIVTHNCCDCDCSGC